MIPYMLRARTTRWLVALLAVAALSGCGLSFSIRHHYQHMRGQRHSHAVDPEQQPAEPREPRKP